MAKAPEEQGGKLSTQMIGPWLATLNHSHKKAIQGLFFFQNLEIPRNPTWLNQ